MPDSPTTPRRLADFTVEELDALPVGARFVDLNDGPEDREGATFTKGANGVWTAPKLLDSTADQLRREMGHCCYVLDLPVEFDLLTAVDTALAWLWDPDADPVEQYERIAEEFRRDTGYLRPGKSEPAEIASEERDRERREAFNAWTAARSRVVLRLMRAAVAKARGGAQ